MAACCLKSYPFIKKFIHQWDNFTGCYPAAHKRVGIAGMQLEMDSSETSCALSPEQTHYRIITIFSHELEILNYL
jgi:hypothetical protein